MATRTIVVYTRRPEQVPAYLYDHTTHLATVADSRTPGTAALLLSTEADTEARAEFLADYQAARLSSGLHSARVFPSYSEAWSHAASLTAPATARPEVSR